MLKRALLVSAAVMAFFAAAQVASADVYVNGYVRSDGTYVQPHYRSQADGNFYNNWSTYPNINPYTGQTGTWHTSPYSYGHGSFGGSSSYRSYSPSRSSWGRY